jgi:methylated-DNA-[protein]-cysteine S-methyltransferase
MWTTTDSPVGELRIVAADGALVAVDFLDPSAPMAGESASHERAVARGLEPVGDRADDDTLLSEAARQLSAYFSGQLEEFDLPLEPHGTPFQQTVWARLRKIPYGETVTYGEIAAELGMGGHAARAVGMANGRNPVPIVVPCHRVVGSSGKLTGYGGGMARKQWLLAHEQAALF